LSNDVESLTGVPPIGIREFVQQNAAAFASAPALPAS
jgi:hypothetical protein